MRRLIECCNGVLKQRFRCLYQLNLLSPIFAGEVVKACCVLHNLLINARGEEFEINDVEIADDVINFLPVLDGPIGGEETN